MEYVKAIFTYNPVEEPQSITCVEYFHSSGGVHAKTVEDWFYMHFEQEPKHKSLIPLDQISKDLFELALNHHRI
jgi:hypothetical protein